MEPRKTNGKKEFMIEYHPISVVEKGTPSVDEARFIRKYILAAFIEHTFNLLFVATLAGYIYLMFGALMYCKLLYAVFAILLMSPYFIVMLHALPLLKGFYKERYAT
ncbi:hypothetical protein CFC21_072139 [Triticum aestivum]|uniref:Uncharacterized protein n=2 Tax=Triticum aestivum TaxID=4565 RepID=A0A3B6LMA5_WHEAT|nr:hypothetical protein CFC21_072139 [Triticum aestivum]